MDSENQQQTQNKIVGKVFTFAVPTVLILAVTFGAGMFVGAATKTGTAVSYGAFGDFGAIPPQGVDFAPLYKAWSILNEKFVPATTTASTTDKDKVYGAIKGLAESFGDPYTTFFPPKESSSFTADISGSFGGVGMEVGSKDGVLVVVAPLKDSPAEHAGVKAGDIILSIDGKTTEGLAVDDAVSKIRGKLGSTVKILLSRKGIEKPFEVSIVRDTIKLPTIDTKLRPDGVFVIALYEFNANAADMFRGAMKEFIKSGSKKLILDLRGNPGGYLDGAVDIASWFLPAGEVVVQESDGPNTEPTVYRSRGYNVLPTGTKMVVLVDQGSASAAEILAGALSENGVAKLVGTRTFGKGSVQEVVPITDDTQIKVTVARWLTPKGRSISGNGLTPDVKIEFTDADIKAKKDVQTDKAIEILNQK